jgi:hypothetical protein
MLAALDAEISSVLDRLSDEFCHFIVVQEPMGRATAVLSTEEFLVILENLRRSRFPGDVAATELTMQQLLGVRNGYSFYVVDLSTSHDRLRDVYKNMPPRHTLIVDHGKIFAAIPEADFHEWIEALSPSDYGSMNSVF